MPEKIRPRSELWRRATDIRVRRSVHNGSRLRDPLVCATLCPFRALSFRRDRREPTGRVDQQRGTSATGKGGSNAGGASGSPQSGGRTSNDGNGGSSGSSGGSA